MDPDILYQRLLNASFRFVSFRPRSKKEFIEFLTKKLKKYRQNDETLIPKVLDRMVEYGYLDDAKFALWWAGQRQRFRPKAWFLIKRELVGKGISREVIESLTEAQNSLKGSETAAIIPDREIALKAVSPKIKNWSKLPVLAFKTKVYAFLYRRGFNSDTIESVFDEIMGKEVK